jgi:hypothetical protein
MSRYEVSCFIQQRGLAYVERNNFLATTQVVLRGSVSVAQIYAELSDAT